jgi:hypothetical protein
MASLPSHRKAIWRRHRTTPPALSSMRPTISVMLSLLAASISMMLLISSIDLGIVNSSEYRTAAAARNTKRNTKYNHYDETFVEIESENIDRETRELDEPNSPLTRDLLLLSTATTTRCGPGLQVTNATSRTEPCGACPVNHFKPSEGTSDCTKCPVDTETFLNGFRYSSVAASSVSTTSLVVVAVKAAAGGSSSTTSVLSGSSEPNLYKTLGRVNCGCPVGSSKAADVFNSAKSSSFGYRIGRLSLTNSLTDWAADGRTKMHIPLSARQYKGEGANAYAKTVSPVPSITDPDHFCVSCSSTAKVTSGGTTNMLNPVGASFTDANQRDSLRVYRNRGWEAVGSAAYTTSSDCACGPWRVQQEIAGSGTSAVSAGAANALAKSYE